MKRLVARLGATLLALTSVTTLTASVSITTDQQNLTGLGDTISWDLSNSGTSQAEVSGGRVGWLFHQDGSDDITDGSDRIAVQNAWQTIELLGLSQIAGNDLGTTTVKSLTDDGNYPIFWWETSNTAPGGADITGAVALAVIVVDTVAPERGEIVDANIVFNGFANTFTTTGAAGAFDIEKVALHEIIHTLVGDHTPIMAATMYYSGNFADGMLGSDRSLSQDDIALLGRTYPGSAFPSATGSLTGTINDIGGNPLFGAHIVAVDSSGRTVGAALSQDDGKYTVAGLAPDFYSVYVDPLDDDTDAFFGDGFFLFSRQELVSLGYYEANGVSPDINTSFKTIGPIGATVLAGNATTVSASLPAGSRSFDVELIGDCNTFFNFLPITVPQGTVGNVIAVAGRNLPQTGTPLSITGPGITITNTTFSANTFPFPCTLLGSTPATDLAIIQITYDVAGTAPSGARTLVVDSGTEKAIVAGGLEVVEAPLFACPDGNEPNDSQAQPTSIDCAPGAPATTTQRPTCFGDPNDVDWYLFESAAPLASVTITANNGGAFPEDLGLFSANGTQLAAVTGPDATLYNHVLPGPGPYLVRVAAPFGAGPYQLNLQCKPSCPTPTAGFAEFHIDEFGAPIPPTTILDDEYRTIHGLELARTGRAEIDPLVNPLNQLMANHNTTTGEFLNMGLPAEGKLFFSFVDPTQGAARQTASCVTFDVGNTMFTPPGTMVGAIAYDPNGAPIAMSPAVAPGGRINLVSPFPPPNSIAYVEVGGPGGAPMHLALDNISASLDVGNPPVSCTATTDIFPINGTSFCSGDVQPVFDLAGSSFGVPPAGCAGLDQLGLFEVRWFLDGVELPGEIFPVLDLTPYALAPGSYSVDAVIACPFDNNCFDDTRVTGGTVTFGIGSPPLIGNTLTVAKNVLDEPIFDFSPVPGTPPSLYSVAFDTVSTGGFSSIAASAPTPPITESPALTGSSIYYYLARAENGTCEGSLRCDETLEIDGPGGDFWQFTTSGPTDLTIVYRNSDDTGLGSSNAMVAIEVGDAGCNGAFGRFEFNASCDYPVEGGPGDPECPEATINLPGAGTYCFLVQPITPVPFSHCYDLDLQAVPAITGPVLIGDDF